MRWSHYFEKFAANWMQMLPSGRRYWETSLDKAFADAQQAFEEMPPAELPAVQQGIFYDWFDELPEDLRTNDGFRRSISKYVSQHYGWNPFAESFTAEPEEDVYVDPELMEPEYLDRLWNS